MGITKEIILAWMKDDHTRSVYLASKFFNISIEETQRILGE